MVVLNKADLATPRDREKLRMFIRGLNPKAEVIETERGRVPLERVLGTGRFDPARLGQPIPWADELCRATKSEADEYGITSFVFRARRPFHPRRLLDLLQDESQTGALLRSKGFVWLATRHGTVGL